MSIFKSELLLVIVAVIFFAVMVHFVNKYIEPSTDAVGTGMQTTIENSFDTVDTNLSGIGN